MRGAISNDRPYRDLIEPVRTSRARSQTGSFRDFDCATRVSKAGHGNDRVWKAWKAKIRLSTLPTLLGNPFGITTFPRPRLLAYFKVQEHERPNPGPLDLKGVVMEVLGPKCNERSGTLIPLRAPRNNEESAMAVLWLRSPSVSALCEVASARYSPFSSASEM